MSGVFPSFPSPPPPPRHGFLLLVLLFCHKSCLFSLSHLSISFLPVNLSVHSWFSRLALPLPLFVFCLLFFWFCCFFLPHDCFSPSSRFPIALLPRRHSDCISFSQLVSALLFDFICLYLSRSALALSLPPSLPPSLSLSLSLSLSAVSLRSVSFFFSLLCSSRGVLFHRFSRCLFSFNCPLPLIVSLCLSLLVFFLCSLLLSAFLAVYILRFLSANLSPLNT